MISTVSQRPRSARELSIVLGIPVSRTYRRIKRLEKEGVLGVRSRVPSGYGKRENLYESRLKGFEIMYEVGSLRVRMEIEGREPITAHEDFREEIMAKLNAPMLEAISSQEVGAAAPRVEILSRASPSA